MYEKAVSTDSSFVLAWVGLASSHRRIYWYYYDRSEEQLKRTKEYLDHAISLSPNLKEVQLEEGIYYYNSKLDYPKALQILEPLKSKYPNDEKTYQIIGNVYRKMGDYNKSLEVYNHAISLNPSNYNLWHNNAYTFWYLRKYDDAENCIKRAIELNPSYHLSQLSLLKLYANTGQIEKAKSYLKNNQKSIDHPDIKVVQAYIEILDGNYDEALQIIQSLSEEVLVDLIYYGTKHIQLGIIYHMMSNKEMSVKHFESEKTILLSKIDQSDNDSRIYRSLGITYAGLGMKKEAIEAGEKALDILSFSNHAMMGFHPEMDMVKILVMVGDYEHALSRLEKIINQTGYITANVLQFDPFWNPIREMEGFKAIINNPKYQVNLSDN
ncbi:tetratricopeptide repeat protein [Bacteroidota bacterium]